MDDAIGVLRAYVFITLREGQDSIDMHRLVRLAMRNWPEGEELESCVSSVIQQLDQAFPFPRHENRDSQAALEFHQDPQGGEVEARHLHNVAASHSLLGQYQKAEQIYRQTPQLREKVLGKEHPDTLHSMNNLASVFFNLEKYQGAEHINRQECKLTEKRESVHTWQYKQPRTCALESGEV